MKKLNPFGVLLIVITSTLLISCGNSEPDVPAIEATEKEAVEQFLEQQTNIKHTGGEAVDSLLTARKINWAESANSSPLAKKNCQEILTWLETTVKNYVSTKDTTVLNSFINIENDVIFNACLNSDNTEFRKKYDQILELLE